MKLGPAARPPTMCKKLEDAVFPVEVEPLEDRVNNSVHALHVDETSKSPFLRTRF